MSIIDDLDQAEAISAKYDSMQGECRACAWLAAQDPSPEKDRIVRALAGRIGKDKLGAIMSKNGIPIGSRTIVRHRRHLKEAGLR